MADTNFDSLSVGGVPVTGAGQVIAGNVFWVKSTGGADVNDGVRGRSKDAPFATIDYAVGICTANNGDVIYVLPTHAETVATAGGIDLDVAGISVIGLGQGADRPTITMSAVASTITFDAASIRFQNFLIKVEHDTTIVLDVNSADCVIDGIEIRSRTAATAREFVTAIDVTGAANGCDRTKILNCHIYSPTAGASRGIELGEVADRVEIRNCTIWGDYGDAAIHNITGKVLTNLLIADCILENSQTGDHALELVSACTGILARNLYKSDMAQGTAADTGSCFSFECYHDDVIDASAILSPAAT